MFHLPVRWGSGLRNRGQTTAPDTVRKSGGRKTENLSHTLDLMSKAKSQTDAGNKKLTVTDKPNLGRDEHGKRECINLPHFSPEIHITSG